MPRYFSNGLRVRTGRTRTPLPSFSNSSRSPGRTPRARRISCGTVICPLLVMRACFFTAILQFLTLPHSSLPWRSECESCFLSQGSHWCVGEHFGVAHPLFVANKGCGFSLCLFAFCLNSVSYPLRFLPLTSRGVSSAITRNQMPHPLQTPTPQRMGHPGLLRFAQPAIYTFGHVTAR
jgi:hypothetical protein